MSENPPPRRRFPIPNALVDALLPTLKDTELRVLLVVLRQTWGWRDPQTGRPKARDWLTHGRLKRDTGRAGEAVSAAVDALVRRGLIVVEDAYGHPLATPAQRRSSTALYFRVGPGVAAAADRLEGKPSRRNTGLRKPKTTKNNQDIDNEALRKTVGQGAATAPPAHEAPLSPEQAAHREQIKEQIRERLATLPRSPH